MMKMAFKAKLLLAISLVALFSTTFTVVFAGEDPELKQCLHQCKQQRGFDRSQKEQCRRACFQYQEEKEKHGGRRGGDEDIVNHDPERERELRDCKGRCDRREQGRQQQQQCRQECEERYEEGGSRRDDSRRGGRRGNPYLFDPVEHVSTSIETREGRLSLLQRFDQRSRLLEGIRNYRLSIVEANPNTFALPSHGDAEAILFVTQGRGTIKLVRRDRVESIDVQRGDIVRVEAGVPVYTINRDESEQLWVVKLFQSVSAPGSFEEFFGAGGENPESFYRAFSPELLDAAFNTRRERWEKVFRGQREGIIVKATREEIQSLSGDSSEESGKWPFGQHESGRSKINLFNQKPTHSNQHGQLKDVDKEDFPRLRDLDVAVSYANITQGSMAGPYYNSKSTKIAVVVQGEGYFEMACPHLGSQEQQQEREQEGSEREWESEGRQQHKSPPSYKKVRGELRPSTVFVVPPGHPIAVVNTGRGSSQGGRSPSRDRGRNLEIMCFEINWEGNVRYPLAGKKNWISRLEEEAKKLAFGVSAREVDGVFQKQDQEMFFPGPEQQQQQQRREGGGQRAYE